MNQKKLIMCKGLPGSGKTTWAREQIASDLHTCRVSKDELRAWLESGGWKWNPEAEIKDVIPARDTEIGLAFDKGFTTVICDDTNFAKKHRIRLWELAKKYGAEFEVKHFSTPIEECIRRDAQRTKPVGEQVIHDMAKKYHVDELIELEPVAKVPGLKAAIICDLDGTLSLFQEKGHRSPYDASRADEDELNVAVWECIYAMYHCGRQIVYISGRLEQFRLQTEAFFKKHFVPPGPLFMRKSNDYRKDWIVKYELFNEHIRGRYNVLFVLDDRKQVVEFWRRLGLPCFQVAEGEF